MGLVREVQLHVEGRQIRPKGSDHGQLRGDIEGMRAVAVLMVLLYHAGAPFLPGGFVGVDVFFVISGFLITTLLVKELAGRGTISLPGFYARRAKRLLPATAVVLVFVPLATVLVLPPTRWVSTAWDVVASSLYGINWRLAAQSVDYLAEGEARSPVQHFWSLAVEEQFYLVWPLVLLLATYGARRRRTPGRQHIPVDSHQDARPSRLTKPLLLGLAAVALPSLSWSIYLTSADAGLAYYVTTTRIWELAIGGGVAIGTAQLSRMPRHIAVPLGWAGLAAVAGTGLILTTATPFPGWIALIPTLGTAAVIACGPAAGRRGPLHLLGAAPMQWVGGLSYSLYLWHWPLIVLATARLGGELTLPQGLAVVLASFVPAYLSRRYVEEPVRRARPLTRTPSLALRLGLVCTLVGVLGGAGLLVAAGPTSPPPSAVVPHITRGEDALKGEEAGAAAVPKFGAEVLRARPLGDPLGTAVDQVASITPDLLHAKQDLDNACDIAGLKETEVKTCQHGKPGARPHILVLGDSHARQWMPALKAIAEAEDWSVVSHTKVSCPFIRAETATAGQPYGSCGEWNRNLRQTLATEAKPELVILSNRMFHLVENGDIINGPTNAAHVTVALRAAIREFTDAGVPVAVIRDTPAPGANIPDCVSSNTDQLTACTTPRSEALRGSEQMAAVKGVKGAHLIDLTNAICPRDPCAPVIGGVLVWRDEHHLSRSYVLSLAQRLHDQLFPLVTASEKGDGAQG